MDKKKLAQWLMVPLTVVLVLLLLTQAPLPDIVSALTSVTFLELAIAFFLYVLLNLARTLRFAVMLDRRDFDEIFKIVCIHSFANNVMPLRSGELTFVYLARVRMGISVGIGMTVIAISRLFDVLAICLMFAATLLIARDNSGYFSGFVPPVLAIAAALALLLSSIVWLNGYVAAFTGRVLMWGIFKRVDFIQSKIEQVCGYCSTLGGRTLPILLLTMVMWIIQALNLYLLSSGMGLGLDPWTAFVGMLLAIILVSLPIQGVGNFGSFEFAWSAIFVALGAPLSAAVTSGFAVHLIILAFTVTLWLYGMAAERLFPSPQKKDMNAVKSF